MFASRRALSPAPPDAAAAIFRAFAMPLFSDFDAADRDAGAFAIIFDAPLRCRFRHLDVCHFPSPPSPPFAIILIFLHAISDFCRCAELFIDEVFMLSYLITRNIFASPACR